jgi:hypothetical protein
MTLCRGQLMKGYCGESTEAKGRRESTLFGVLPCLAGGEGSRVNAWFVL